MGEAYFSLKSKLEELGYNNKLPVDAVPLVGCILADLLQTTRSLQHYMEMSKEALMQRDSMMLEAEPFRCENAKLIQENNRLNKELIDLKEENERLCRESKRKIKSLSEELVKKDAEITKLRHELRDLSLRGLCADTQSSRNRSRRKEAGDSIPPNNCICEPKASNLEQENTELVKKIYALEDRNEALSDEVALLENQIEHRDNEIIRLNILLEGGRPMAAIAKDCCKVNIDTKVAELLKELKQMEKVNELLKKEIDSGLEKQHEAMLRALNLAEKNQKLQDELQKVDALALKVEDEANKQINEMKQEVSSLQAKLENLTKRNAELEKEVSKKQSIDQIPATLYKVHDSLTKAQKENKDLQNQLKELFDLNKSLKDKVQSLTKEQITPRKLPSADLGETMKYPTKDEVQLLLEEERKKYIKHVEDIQMKLAESIDSFNNHLQKCKDKDIGPKNGTKEKAFIKDLHNKLCEAEQKMLMLKKENDELKEKLAKQSEGAKQNYKDIISQLNVENAELTKENISLSQKLSQFKNLLKPKDLTDHLKREIHKLKDEIEKLSNEMQVLNKDKEEYKACYKDASDSVDRLRRDLAFKQKEIEHLQEENSSYKITSRTGKASADQLKDECNFLREQIKRMQSDVIKEKTIASQIKNIQIETERSTNEVQNELLCTQKKLHLSQDTIDALERKCKDLQSEIMSLQNDKSNLIENIKKVDQERDKLVIELDHKTENICVLEQKLKSRSYEIIKLENEISELKKSMNINKVSEHQLADYESQITFLNGEITRLQKKLDTAFMENKHLQNSLADANGNLKLTRIEYEKSRKEVDGLKQQLQHYVAEIRRIEELLSQKEAERSDMLEHFASLSVEANILENTNHSLESESASKSNQLQSLVSKIEDLEEKLQDKEQIIDNQSTRIANMSCKVTALENEVKLLTEEKTILEQNATYLKKMCNNLQKEYETLNTDRGDTDSELKLYENRIKSLSKAKDRIEGEKEEINNKWTTTERLLENARQEIIELKLALQDATAETKSLQSRLSAISRESARYDTSEASLRQELELPLMLEEIQEISRESDGDSSRYREVNKRYSRYTHGSTL